jgi:hypothetical protein
LYILKMNLKKKPAIYLFIGKPASGKSHLIKSMFYDFQKVGYFKFMLAFVRTKFNHDYDWLPDEYVLDNFSEEKVLNHVSKLREYRRRTGKQCPPNAIIFDDLLGTIDWYHPGMTNWLCSYRHTNTSIFITAQYLLSKSTATSLREMINYAFLFNSKQKNSLKGYYEAFGQLYEKYDYFVHEFQRITKQKYHCMVYNANQDELEENYLDYVANEKTPVFKLKYKIS